MAKGRIADLHAALTWDLADFERGTARIELSFNSLLEKGRELANRFRNIGRSMTRGLTVPIAGVATAIGAMAKVSSEELKQIGNSARLAGEDMERFQRQSHAAREVGIDTEKLGDIFKDTREKIGDFAATGGGEMADFFENIAPRVNLTAEAFRGLSGKDGLQLYYDSLVRAGASHEEIVFYMESIADEATALIPLLERNGQLFDEYGKRGPVFNENQVKALEAYRHALEDIGYALDRIVIAAVNSGLIDMITGIAEKIADFITWISETNPALLRFAGGVALAVAALGPLVMVMQALAVVILPLFLARLGPVWLALSALINPIGTLLVFLTKLSGGFSALVGAGGGVMSILGRLALLVARLNPITAALSVAFLLFKDNVIDALGRVWDKAQEALGPAFGRLMEAVGSLVARISDAFQKFADSEFGQFLSLMIDRIGRLIEILIEIAGSAVIYAIETLLNRLATLTQGVSDIVRVVTLLFQGDWASAWELAGQIVDNVVADMKSSFHGFISVIHDALALLGILEERQETFQPGHSKSFAELVGDRGGQNRPEPEGFLGALPKGSKDKGAKSGRSEQELAARREELDLEHQLTLAREERDFAAVRALERQLELKRRIQQYEDAGLKAADAKARAEEELNELAKARRDAFQEELEDEVLRSQLREARVRQDEFAIRTIEEELFLQEGIEDLEQRGLERAQAEEIVQRRLLGLQQARADVIAERARDEELARQIELSRIRGDDPRDTQALEDEARLRDRVRQLQRDQGLSLQEATTAAMKEASDLSQAHLQGNIRDAFRGGVQAALDGDLKGFFKRWMEDASFNALSRVLNRLADSLGSLIAGNAGGGGGGFLSLIGSALGFIGGGNGGETSASLGHSGQFSGILKANNGAKMRLGGLAGFDRNLLSLNGNPIARVSRGEVLDIKTAHDRSGAGGKLQVEVVANNDGFGAIVRDQAGRVLAEAAPSLIEAGGNAGLAKVTAQSDRALA